jgi:Ca2+-binding RTX toxin-like protein
VFNSGLSNSINFADGSYFRGFETILVLLTGSGNDQLIQSGRVNNMLSVRGGDDTVNAGLGLDTIFGGSGVDILILDYSQGDTANVGGAIW